MFMFRLTLVVGFFLGVFLISNCLEVWRFGGFGDYGMGV